MFRQGICLFGGRRERERTWGHIGGVGGTVEVGPREMKGWGWECYVVKALVCWTVSSDSAAPCVALELVVEKLGAWWMQSEEGAGGEFAERVRGFAQVEGPEETQMVRLNPVIYSVVPLETGGLLGSLMAALVVGLFVAVVWERCVVAGQTLVAALVCFEQGVGWRWVGS